MSKYTKPELTPENEKEEMLVMALLRKCRGQEVNYNNASGTTSADWEEDKLFLDIEYYKPQKKLNIPWEHIKPEFKVAVIDPNGRIYTLTREPEQNSDGWSCLGSKCAELTALKIDTDGIDWRESLTKRPENGDENE